MRTLLRSLLLVAAASSPALAQEAHKADLLQPAYGLMVWTLVIFVVLLLVLTKFAFKPITAAVEAREQALQAAIDAARRDREEAARLLAEHRAALDASRAEGQKLIADARVAAERMRAELIEQAAERAKAIAELRREAVDLAIIGASKVINESLDNAKNRKLVESFLASISPTAVSASR